MRTSNLINIGTLSPRAFVFMALRKTESNDVEHVRDSWASCPTTLSTAKLLTTLSF